MKTSALKIIDPPQNDQNSEKIYCQHCGSDHYNKGGIIETGKQFYICKDCNRRYIKTSHSDRQDPELLCSHCGSNHYQKGGYMRSGKQRYYCHDCKRFFAKTYDHVMCRHCGSEDYAPAGFSKKRKVRCYLCLSCHKRFRETYVYKPRAQDYIYLADLGIDVYQHRYTAVIAFDAIEQTWFRDLCKQFIRYIAPMRAQGTTLNYFQSLRQFSRFLSDHYPLSTLEIITRSVIVHYIQYLAQLGMSLGTQKYRLSHLRKFLEIGNLNSWFSIPTYLIQPEDFSRKQPLRLPRYIPDDVVQQINQNLDKLYKPVMRMVLVEQEFGLRASELLSLTYQCIEQDTKGQWNLKLFRRKTKQEDRLPIVNLEIVRVIQEQQEYIRTQLGDQYNYLFCGNQVGSYSQFRPQPKLMSDQSFNNYLNQFAKDADIRDSSGKLWHFQSHQFRHTVGTRMINNGVPQHIVQRYLGHASANMTAVYAHIHDQTLRLAAEKFHENIVNVSGELIPINNPDLEANEDLNWLRQQMNAQTLPNGYCARPLVKGPCPHANACLTCGDFRTTQTFLELHKEELRRTEALIAAAQEKGWQRQVETNEIVATNLRKIITRLQAS